MDIFFFYYSHQQNETLPTATNSHLAYEQTALSKRKAIPFKYLADNSTESAGDPQEVIRDDFYNQLTGNATIMNFLDIKSQGQTKSPLPPR